MDRTEWLTIIIRETNRFVSAHEQALKEAWKRDGTVDTLGEKIDDHVHEVMTDHELINDDDLWGLIRWSNLRRPPPVLWRDAEDWPSVLVRVAYACFAFDLARYSEQIVAGKLPRVEPEQMIFLKEKGEEDRREDEEASEDQGNGDN